MISKCVYSCSPISILLTKFQDCSKRLFHSKCVPEPPATRRAKAMWLCTQCNPLTIHTAATVVKARRS
jgi:hypothetical protein